MAQYMQQFAEALKNYGQQKDPTMQQYEQELMKPQDGNANAHLVSLVDNLTGSNFSSQLPKKESMKDRLAQLLQLRQGVESQKLSGLGKLADIEANAADKSMQRAFQEKMYGLQLAKATAKMNQKPKMGSEDKKALGFTSTLLKELPKLRSIYEQDAGTIRPGVAQVFGQNEAELVANALAENYGRLQSGGAISKDEESRFLGRLGSLMDSKEIRLQKLKQIEDEIMEKHNLYGGGAIGGAERAPSTGSPEDAEAFQWAAQNPNDPRAQQILQMMGK